MLDFFSVKGLGEVRGGSERRGDRKKGKKKKRGKKDKARVSQKERWTRLSCAGSENGQRDGVGRASIPLEGRGRSHQSEEMDRGCPANEAGRNAAPCSKPSGAEPAV